MERGNYSDKRKVTTSLGIVEIFKIDNQNQRFVPVTSQMSLREAIEWAFNTTTFKPIIKRTIYGRTSFFYIVRLSEKGKQLQENETLLTYELTLNSNSHIEELASMP